MDVKNKELKTKDMKAGDVLVGQIYDDLKTLLDNDTDMANQTSSSIQSINNQITQTNNNIKTIVNNRLGSIKVDGSTVNFTYSDNAEIGETQHFLNAGSGIAAGTYSLNSLLNELVKRSHYHGKWDATKNCNCSYCGRCYETPNDGGDGV